MLNLSGNATANGDLDLGLQLDYTLQKMINFLSIPLYGEEIDILGLKIGFEIVLDFDILAQLHVDGRADVTAGLKYVTLTSVGATLVIGYNAFLQHDETGTQTAHGAEILEYIHRNPAIKVQASKSAKNDTNFSQK